MQLPAQERYTQVQVPTADGLLWAGVWEPEPGPAGETADWPATVLAIHGITANHRCWSFLADRLPEVRLIAPDLRGRGGSSAVGGPFGLAAHADDMARVLDALDVAKATVVGHSMGGFVSLVTADKYSARVDDLVLVDGGLPLASSRGVDAAQVEEAVVAPIAERLRLRFPDVPTGVDLWRRHPAFVDEWTPVTEDYATYDLAGEPGEVASRVRLEAVERDSADLLRGSALPAALERLRHPTQWLVAPRGLLDETPPLYPAEAVAEWRRRYPQVEVREVADVNHYTIVLSERGADAVAAAVRRSPV